MPGKDRLIVLSDDVYALTPKGERELGGVGTSLSPSELEVLVLIDGKSTVAESAERARTLAPDAVGHEVFRRVLERVAAPPLSVEIECVVGHVLERVVDGVEEPAQFVR